MNAIVIKYSDIARCPISSLSPTHYYISEDQQVHCRCVKEEGQADERHA